MTGSLRLGLAVILAVLNLALVSCDALPESVEPSIPPVADDYGDLPSFEFADPGATPVISTPPPLDPDPIFGTVDGASTVRIEPIKTPRQSSTRIMPTVDESAGTVPELRPTPSPPNFLGEKQTQLVSELRTLLGDGEWRLSEDLTVQNLLVQLISLHHLGAGNERKNRDAILRAFDRVEQPSTRLKHAMAAYYHELGAEDACNALFPTTGTASRQARRNGPVIAGVELISLRRDKVRISSARDIRSLKGFRGGDELELEVELHDFTARPAGQAFRSEFAVNGRLLTADGTELQNESLTREPLFEEFDTARPKLYEFTVPAYRLPVRLLPGKYQIEIRVLDLVNAGFSTTTFPVDIR